MVYNTQKLAGWGNYPMVTSKVITLSDSHGLEPQSLDLKVIARGLGRSYGDQAINESQLVAKCEELSQIISFDEETGLLECEAGVSLAKIIEVFAPKGWFPMVCPGTKYVTIGGAIANDIHGKAHHIDGSFVNSVLAFTILLADGTIKKATREDNGDLFWACFGGLGLLGIIMTAKIQLRRIETTYFKQKAIVANSIEEMVDAIEASNETYNYSVAWIDPLAKGGKLGHGVLTLGNKALLDDLPGKLQKEPLKVSRPGKLNVPLFFPDFALNTLTVRFLNQVIYGVQKSAPGIVHYEKFFFPLDAINNWNRGYGRRGFTQYQFVIPEQDAKRHLRIILEKIAHSGCTPFLNVLKKMGKGQGGLLSFPFEGYTLAIDFPITKKLFAFIHELDQLVLEYGGRVYLGKDALLERETFRAMYPQYKDWLKIKEKYDPMNVFSSNISRRLGLE